MFFDSIYNCNIRNYELVEENGNFKSIKRFPCVGGFNVYQDMSLKLIDEFGASSKFEKIFFLKKDILKLINKYIVVYAKDGESEAKKYVTMINVKNKELDELIKKIHEKDEDARKRNATQHRILSEWSKTDTRILTVFEYYNYLNDYKKLAEDVKADRLSVNSKG